MRKLLTALVVLGLFVVPLRAADAAPGALVFADEFDGTAIDRTKWAIHSNAEADQCLGNKNNQQLEWHTWDALSVSNGKLTRTGTRSPSSSAPTRPSGISTATRSAGRAPTPPAPVTR